MQPSQNDPQSKEEALPESSASLTDTLSAAEQAFQAYKVRFHAAGGLLKSEAQLSLKALLVCCACVLVLVGLGLLAWAALLVAVALGLTGLGAHWLWVIGSVIAINIIAMLAVKHIFKKTTRSIGFKTSSKALFSDNQQEPST